MSDYRKHLENEQRAIEELKREQFPPGKFTPEAFPALFKGGELNLDVTVSMGYIEDLGPSQENRLGNKVVHEAAKVEFQVKRVGLLSPDFTEKIRSDLETWLRQWLEENENSA